MTIDPFSILKIHRNPFLPDLLGGYQGDFCRPTLNSALLEQIFLELKAYLTDKLSQHAYTFVIKGPQGCGKTLLLRRIASYILKVDRMNDIFESSGVRLQMCFTSSNAEIQKHFLGIWIPILRHMLAKWAQF